MNVNVRFNKKALEKSRALMLWGKKYYQKYDQMKNFSNVTASI